MGLELTLDVETIPTQKQIFIDGIDIACPGNYTKADSITKWEKEKKPALLDEAYRKTSLDSTKGELIVIGWAINKAEPQAVYRELGESEGDLLQGFYDAIAPYLIAGGFHAKTRWIGHNILRFDLPYLYHRTKINKVNPSISVPYDSKPWDERIFDTQATWKAASNASSSLEAICNAIGIPVKTDMHGSEVWDYVRAGKVKRVAEYCKEDITATRSLYNVLK